jgi:HAD superfamily hydrolase (TIGR01490 family)
MSSGAAPRPSRSAAFFDVDGTLLDTNIVQFYVHFRTAHMAPLRRWFWRLAYLRRVPLLYALDQASRSAFNRLFYAQYEGMPAEATRALAAATFETFALPRLFEDARATVRRHQSAGDRVVLATGTLSFIAEPLAEYLSADAVLAAELEVRDGKFTGNMVGEPLSDEVKAGAVRRFASEHGIDLSRSYAYGDSASDVAMLQVVGHPVAVNPSRRLRKIAQRQGWPIRRWC